MAISLTPLITWILSPFTWRIDLADPELGDEIIDQLWRAK